jgi:hypothetical protein
VPPYHCRAVDRGTAVDNGVSDTRMGFGELRFGSVETATELSPPVEKGRPAAAALLLEGADALGGGAVGGAGQQLGGKACPAVLDFLSQDLGPIHAGLFQLAGAHVVAQGRLVDAVDVLAEPLVNLPVVEPLPGPLVDLGDGGLTQQSLQMMQTRLVVVNSRGIPCFSRPRASECQATAFSSSV